jgi:S-adenosylmethionine:tRNA ribosyltransferase-isomerase
MHASDFDYDLPDELIAREPARPRDSARMLALDARTGLFTDSRFQDLPGFLEPSDVLVLNDTRVVRARLHGRLERSSGTSRDIEVFFSEIGNSNKRFPVLCRPGRRIRAGDRVIFGNDAIVGVFTGNGENGLHEIELESSEPIESILERYGEIPLPPYISRKETSSDDTDYQTVFAAHLGAVAAPTAGLHFTAPAMDRIRAKGIEIVTITLHVGLGTFLPLRTENPEEHILHPERFELSAAAAERLELARREGRRIVAVGTTTTRALEYMVHTWNEFRPTTGETNLYILPGFQFKAIGALLTNFHLPQSTLLMLVSAFAGRDAVLAAYKHAVKARYRFYSYGDCMWISGTHTAIR